MHLKPHSDGSFLTDAPDALAAHLHGRYNLSCVRPCLNEAYRLASDSGSMVVIIHQNGTVFVQGRQAKAATLLLTDLREEGGEAA